VSVSHSEPPAYDARHTPGWGTITKALQSIRGSGAIHGPGFSDPRALHRRVGTHDYGIVGLTGIIINVGKVREMCRLVRVREPRTFVDRRNWR
jgi:hypothetical protein